MKKYNLVIKESVQYIEKGEFPTLMIGNNGLSRFKLLCKKQIILDDTPFTLMHNVEGYRNEEATTFTQQEIDKLPYGFVKLFDMIAVEEELYYIKLPYGKNKYLNQNMTNGLVLYANNEQCETYQTKFTLDYIKETFTLFVEFAVKVEEEK